MDNPLNSLVVPCSQKDQETSMNEYVDKLIVQLKNKDVKGKNYVLKFKEDDFHQVKKDQKNCELLDVFIVEPLDTQKFISITTHLSNDVLTFWIKCNSESYALQKPITESHVREILLHACRCDIDMVMWIPK